MFGYYGDKAELAALYPAPRHDLIVEPFAGSAAYALHGDHWRREVLLVERDPRLAAVWRWLIEEATPAAVLDLPDLQPGSRSDELLHVVHAGDPAVLEAGWVTGTVALQQSWARTRQQMADHLDRVKHWTVLEGHHLAAPDVEATWFIDPPYQGEAGNPYQFGGGDLDPHELRAWILSRRGQVIACESGIADYLPFQPLRPGVDIPGDPHAELVWTEDHPAGP